MLGDMLSVRAAAEKPPLSTTFTKVAMLVMRSMRSPDHAPGSQSCPVVWPYQVASDHVCSHSRHVRMGPLRRAHCSAGSNLKQAIFFLRYRLPQRSTLFPYTTRS